MGKFLLLFLAMLMAMLPSLADAAESDQEIKKKIIQDSINNYQGRCPCPYNIMRNGKRCGHFSAYIKPNGRSPLCYEGDISPAMVEAYRNRRR